MRVLAFSDVTEWGEPQYQIINQIDPDIIILAGDLIWDGMHAFKKIIYSVVYTFNHV